MKHTPPGPLRQPANRPPTRCARWVLALGLLVLAPVAAAADAVAGRVVRVVDGDTMVFVGADHSPLKVRLHGIDAPECGMPFGPQAQQLLEGLVLGKAVQLVSQGQDRHQRTVATLAAGGQDVGLVLLRAGMAWHDGRFDRPRGGPVAAAYREAQQSARAQALGLWAQPAAAAPWAWRAELPGVRHRGACAEPTRPGTTDTRAGRRAAGRESAS